MSLELALTAIAESLQALAASNIKAAEIYAAGRNNGGVGASTTEPVPEKETPEKETPEKKTAPKKTSPKKQVETPADPDVEKEPVKEEETEKPRKTEIDADKLKDEIRAVFTKLSEKRADLPMAVLKGEGHARLSLVEPDDLPALLLAAKDTLKSLTPEYE